MSLSDLRRLTVAEFEAIVEQWSRGREADFHDSWERMRLHATICIQPHLKKHLSAKQLLPLPWDDRKPDRKPQPILTKEQRLEAFEYRMKKKKNG
ncbi:MAG: hypothetical protein K2J06_03200 [Muribaculaceae bacterium]|nr:hypothetical protein [Muribaculaceae bacterium]